MAIPSVPGAMIAAQLASPSSEMQDPVSVAATTTIAPTTRLTFVVGSTTINTITPPYAGAHQLCLIWAQATTSALTTAGNIKTATTLLTGQSPVYFEYNPIEAKYYVQIN